MVKLLDKVAGIDEFTDKDKVTYYFQDCTRRFIVDWVEETFDTHKPEAMAFWNDEHDEVIDWNELAVSHKESPQEACRDCLRQMCEKGFCSSIVLGDL